MPTDAPTALDVFVAMPAALRMAIADLPEFKPHILTLITPTVDFSKDHRVTHENLFTSIKQALGAPSKSHPVETLSGEPLDLMIDKDHQCRFVAESETFTMPDMRVLSEDLTERQKGLKALGAASLCAEDLRVWQDTIETGPICDSEVFELHMDIAETPTGILQEFDQAWELGEIDFEQIVPSDERYRRRLSGNIDGAENVKTFAKRFAAGKLDFLPRTPRRYRWHRAFALCNHSLITKSLPIEISSIREATSLINWARQSGSPVIMTAVLEYLLLRFKRISEIDAAIADLLRTLLELDPDFEAAEYVTLSNLLISIDAIIARSPSLQNLPLFERRYYAISQASFIQSFSQHTPESLSVLANELHSRLGMFGLIKAIIDTRETPRWNPEQYDPRDLFADHLGRIYNAVSALDDLDELPRLRELMDIDSKTGFFARFHGLRAFRCGYLEGDLSANQVLPDTWLESIDNELDETPFTVNSLISLVNVVPLGQIAAAQYEKLVSIISGLGFFMRGIESEEQAATIFVGLASLAVIRKDESFAKTVGTLLRRHAQNVRYALKPHMYFRASVWLSRAFADERDGLAWLAEQVEFLSFSDLDEKRAQQLANEIEVTCRVAPRFWIPLSRSRNALRAITSAG